MTAIAERSAIDVDHLIRPDRVHRAVYTDAAIFDEEMQRIWEQTWVFIGHESEVAQPGDYKTTWMGRNPVIMCRDKGSGLNVLMNRCMHRGAVVCREERGNSTAFRCSYHGWTYNNRGELAVVTAKGGYGPDFDQSTMGLLRAARVEAYRGFVFASLNPDVLPLPQHLGRARHYLDLCVDYAPEGAIDVRSGAQRYGYPANWKFQIENWTDHYHAAIVHETAFALRGRTNGRNPPPDPETGEYSRQDTGWVTSMPHGINMERTRGGPAGTTFGGAAFPGWEEYTRVLGERRGEQRYAELMAGDFQVMVFPNFFIQPRRQHFRVLRPVAVDRTEIWAYPYTLRGAPGEFNRKMVEDMAWWASAAGFGQPDDLEQFVRCQTGLQVSAAEWVMFNRAMHLEEQLPEGEIRGESETTMRGIYREWKRLMGA
jgi:benzoate/toluate 1,2-dioxygenase subunit alpha